MPFKNRKNLEKFLAFAIGLVFVGLLFAGIEIFFGNLLKTSGPKKYITNFSHRNDRADIKKDFEIPLKLPDKLPQERRNKGNCDQKMFPIAKVHFDVFPLEYVGEGFLRLPVRSYREMRFANFDGVNLEPYMNSYYTIDSYLRRNTPKQEKKRAESYVMLIGDSNTYGEGVEDNQTIAYYLGQMLPRQRVYNYSVPAVYPGELLERVNLIQQKELPEKKGIALYFYSDYHILRNIGSINEVGDWGREKPYYFEGDHESIHATGAFSSVRPFWSIFMQLLFQSNVVKYFQYDFRPQEKDLRFQTLLLRHIQEVVSKVGAKKFIVLIMPRNFDAYLLIPYLERAEIRYINMADIDLKEYVFENIFLKNDFHNSPEANQMIAKILSSVLIRENDL